MSEFPYEFSPQLNEIAKALAAAQGELEDAKKDAVNPHFKNRYASLSSVRAAITPVFAKHGLAVTQLNEPHGDAGVCVVTMLIHASGQWLRSKLFVPATKKDAQGFGSALSYARRYALASIANIATDDDDDAEEATKPPAKTQAPAAVVDLIDVASLEKTLLEAPTPEAFAAAEAKIGRLVGKMDPKDRDRLRSAREKRAKQFAAAEAS